MSGRQIGIDFRRPETQSTVFVEFQQLVIPIHIIVLQLLMATTIIGGEFGNSQYR